MQMAFDQRTDSKASVRYVVAIVTLTLAVGLGLAVAHSAPAKPVTDANDVSGPLDITRAEITQSGKDAIIEVRTSGEWGTPDLDGSPDTLGIGTSYVCVEVKQGGDTNRICIRHKLDGAEGNEMVVSKLDDSGTVVNKRKVESKVSRPNTRSFIARAPLGTFGFTTAKYNWRAATSYLGLPDCDPAACTDLAPDDRWLKREFVEPYVEACKPRNKGLVLNGPRKRKRVALTFDDGPAPATSSIVKILNSRNAKGTFFVIGEQVGGSGAKLLKKMSRQGHEIANHSLHHEIYPGYSSLRSTNRAIQRATGFKPCSFRPPYGAVNSGVLSAARSNGMTTVNWDRDTMDWTTPGSGSIASVGASAGSGSIVLMHDGGGIRSQTVAALPSIISSLKSRGYKLVTVSQLLGNKLVWGPR
jgi:peptidoglycan/xylan/chitin deacetylase (PgdA/CDA1 family)